MIVKIISGKTLNYFHTPHLIGIFTIILIILNPEITAGQKLFMYFKPVKSSSSLSFPIFRKQIEHDRSSYELHSNNNERPSGISSMENEIGSSEEVTNLRPIYIFRHPNHQHKHSQSFQLNSVPPRITPLFIRDSGSANRNVVGTGSNNPKIWFPHNFESQPVNMDGEAMFKVNDYSDGKLLLLNRNNHYYTGGPSMLGNENENHFNHDLNNNSDGSGEMDETDSVEDENVREDVALPRPPLVTQLSPLIKQDAISSHDDLLPNQKQCILEGHQVRFDPITGGCFTVGTKGPCGKFMIFSAIPDDNINGYCDCDYDSFDRPMAFVGGKCQFLYTQANCFSGSWLTGVTLNGKPICQENPCQSPASYFSNGNSQNSVVLFKGECTKLNGPSRHCRRQDEVVLFPKGSSVPACGFPKSTKRIYRRQISNINRFVCGPGMRRHRVTKRCIRTVRRALVFHRK